MIAAWGVYCVVVAALLGLAALAGEGALRALGRPVRWVWAGAMLGSLGVPLAGWLGWSLRLTGAGSAQVGAEGAVAVDAAPLLVDLAALQTPLLSDRALAVGWLVASGLALLVVGSAVLRLARARARWRQGVVTGVPVLVSAAVGPAALGVVRGAIVIPAWALSLESRLRRLMLLHEAEHLRAGDPRLLLAALIVLAAMPWNPVLWWQFWRLRQALELDCDARVLRRAPNHRSYGLLLLEVGRRRSGGGLAATGLSEPRSFLERRIRMMGKGSLKVRRGRAIAAGGVAVGLALLACEAERPTAAGGVGEGAKAPMPSVNALPLIATGGRQCDPAVFVDGKRVDAAASGSKSLDAHIKQEEIASIEVLKGAAAALRFGADANCGAILITSTKASAETEGKSATQAAASREMMLKTATRSSRGGEGEDRPRITPFDRKPELLNREEVVVAIERAYPPQLRSAGVGGTARLWFKIDERGQVAQATVKSSSGREELDAAAVQVARMMKFAPAGLNGANVAVFIELPITFRAQEAK
jgi:TonB family protein